MIHNLARRLDKIEKEVSPKPVCIRLPRSFLQLSKSWRDRNPGGNPDELIEVALPAGCRNLSDLTALADKVRKAKEQLSDNGGEKPKEETDSQVAQPQAT
jgi:hypothetical protein